MSHDYFFFSAFALGWSPHCVWAFWRSQYGASAKPTRTECGFPRGESRKSRFLDEGHASRRGVTIVMTRRGDQAPVAQRDDALSLSFRRPYCFA